MANINLTRTSYGPAVAGVPTPNVAMAVAAYLVDDTAGIVGTPYTTTTDSAGTWVLTVPENTTHDHYVVVEATAGEGGQTLRWEAWAPSGLPSYDLRDIARKSPETGPPGLIVPNVAVAGAPTNSHLELGSLTITQADTSTTALTVKSAGLSYTASLADFKDADDNIITHIGSTGKFVTSAVERVVQQADVGGGNVIRASLDNDSSLNFADGSTVGDTKFKRLAAGTAGMAAGHLLAADAGATGSRPTATVVGSQWFDTTLNKPIWWDGANWRDGTGTIV